MVRWWVILVLLLPLGFVFASRDCVQEIIELEKKSGESNDVDEYTVIPVGGNASAMTHPGGSETGRAIRSPTWVNQDSPTSEDYWRLGLALRKKRQVDEAIAAYRKAIELDPDDARPSYSLAQSLRWDKRQLDEAIASYRIAISLEPDFARAHHSLGHALWHEGRVGEAIASYQNAVASYKKAPPVDSAYARVQIRLGDALRNEGRLDEADASYRRAIELRPDDGWAHYNLGLALRESGHEEEAQQELNEARRLGYRPDRHRLRDYEPSKIDLEAVFNRRAPSDGPQSRVLKVKRNTAIYEEPRVSSKRLARLSDGETVRVIGKADGDFWEVQYGDLHDLHGFVHDAKLNRSITTPASVGGDIRPPKKIKDVSPEYPEKAKQAQAEGAVVLEATIDPKGNVRNVRVLQSIPLLDQSAIEAVQQWKYEPTFLEGVPVPIKMTVTVSFALGN